MKIYFFYLAIIILGITSCGEMYSEDNLTIHKNDNSVISEIEYRSTSDNSLWKIVCDSLGVPNRFEVVNQNQIKCELILNKDFKQKELGIYSDSGNALKLFKFNENKLVGLDDYLLKNNNNYILNQWRYTDKDENIIQDEGFFLEIDIDDTINRIGKPFAEIELKGGKGLKGLACYADNKVYYPINRKFRLPLNTVSHGLKELKGYVINYDTSFSKDGDWTVNELRINFKKLYFVNR